MVDKTTILKNQILETLHAAMPGYADCFSPFWESRVALLLARQTTSAAAVLKAGHSGLQGIVAKEDIPSRKATLAKVLAWAEQAPAAEPHTEQLRLVLCSLDDDRLSKSRQIKELERMLAGCIAATPYALLLAIPGLYVVSVADLAGEIGPIELYRDANAITGRAALLPSRYQSDRVDCANGPLRRRGNRRLRAVLMQAAEGLVNCNHYFQAQAGQWRRLGKNACWIRVKVAKRLSRLLYAMVAGKQMINHPCCRERHYILQKLRQFHGDHDTTPAQLRGDLEAVVGQLPAAHVREEAKPLPEYLEALGKRRGVVPLAEIIPIVLARLGLAAVESPAEGAGLS